MENSEESEDQQDQGFSKVNFDQESSSEADEEEWAEPRRQAKAKTTQVFKISNPEGLTQDVLPFILSDQQISEKQKRWK